MVVPNCSELTGVCCWLDAVAQAYGMKLLRKIENTEYKVRASTRQWGEGGEEEGQQFLFRFQHGPFFDD